MLAQDYKRTKLKEKANIKFEINQGFEDAIQSDLSQHEMRKKTIVKTK